MYGWVVIVLMVIGWCGVWVAGCMYGSITARYGLLQLYDWCMGYVKVSKCTCHRIKALPSLTYQSQRLMASTHIIPK